jgi:hypothetical protein
VCQGDLLSQDSDQCGQSRVKNEGSLPTSGERVFALASSWRDAEDGGWRGRAPAVPLASKENSLVWRRELVVSFRPRIIKCEMKKPMHDVQLGSCSMPMWTGDI